MKTSSEIPTTGPVAGHLQQLDTHVTLNNLGLEQQTKRDVGPFDILCVGYNICNCWVGLAATMVIGLEQGGTVTVIYGTFVVTFAMACSAATMAELSSVYPTAGASNIFGWLSICSGITIQPGQFISAVRLFYNPDLEIPAWEYFLYFQATNLVFLLYNIFGLRRTRWIHDVGFFFSICTFVIIFISCLARAQSYQSNTFVWTDFPKPESGWNSRAVVFLTGMANPNFMYAGLDGAVHLAEECAHASKTVPRALFSTIVVGFVVAFAFGLAMLYTLTDFRQVLDNITGVPIYEIWFQATRSGVAATIFMMLLLCIACFALNACVEVTARLTWSFARDNAIIGSKFMGSIHPRWEVPVWALVANATVILIIGCIYLGSSTAFNAFIGTALVLQQCSFALPAALLLWHKRSSSVLPPHRYIRLGPLGWIANAVTVLFFLLILVMYCFPIELPVTGSNMNYTSVVIGIMVIFSAINWFVHAGRKFKGPRLLAEVPRD
ncbi:Amino acid/polyamine transporter I [Metarhizium guizhouense ARSEF 977]|uniref:Amino acid/polyamine transporter I n=1 Tax=Metarhizium guizhouense (strain ARSEF 977) TaxID=1276136 RepID=A0A0B4GZZ4_METGA|nr:Amino acid/polyamine transporter I [Metarhizium guizhouense ARSEF 977]